MKKLHLILLLLLNLLLFSCRAETEYNEKIDAIVSLNLYETSNYNLGSGNQSFITFGVPDDYTFPSKNLNKEEINVIISERKKQRLKADSLMNKFLIMNSWQEKDVYFSKMRSHIKSLHLYFIVEQEMAISIINDLVQKSSNIKLTNEELHKLKKYIIILDKNKFPDVVFMATALNLARSMFNDDEVNSIINGTIKRAKDKLEKCSYCISEGRNIFEIRRSEYYKSWNTAIIGID